MARMRQPKTQPQKKEKPKNRFQIAKEKRDKETTVLAERHIVKPSNEHFARLKEICHLSKNLYNHANFLIRKTFVSNRQWLRYERIEFLTRTNTEYPDYRAMPTAQMAQQTLRALDSNWSSFFASIKEWKKNPSKFTGRPRLPRYLPKEGYFVAVVTSQNARFKNDGLIHFPAAFGGFTLRPSNLPPGVKLQQVRFEFDGVNIVTEVVYRVPKPEALPANGRVMGIDLGVSNLAACVTNTGTGPMLFKGGPARDTNQYYNKKLAAIKSCAGKRNKNKKPKRATQLAKKRNHKINDYMHKVSKKIVDKCVEQDIRTIVIGKNKGWKVAPKMSKVSNQKFVAIPLARLIELIKYKAGLRGITVLTHEESYTSGTSFLDGELPKKKYYDKSRRKKRGLFVTNKGLKINADVNAAFQIMRKVFPKVSSDGIEGVVLRPSVVAV